MRVMGGYIGGILDRQGGRGGQVIYNMRNNGVYTEKESLVEISLVFF